MQVWSLIIEGFRALAERDAILSDRLTQLEAENGIEVEGESITSAQLQELVTKMQQHLAPPPLATATQTEPNPTELNAAR